jgi:anti-anti-sigma factor
VALLTGLPGHALAIRVEVSPGLVMVVLGGELDMVTAPELAGQLAGVLGGRPQRLVFDMAGVRFIDCAAARLISGTARHLPPGQRPVIRRPSRPVRRLLHLTGMDSCCALASW